MAATASKAAALIRIAITEAAFAGIKTALPFSNTGYESSCSAGGGYFIWLDRRTRDTRCRTPAEEGYSETIIRPPKADSHRRRTAETGG